MNKQSLILKNQFKKENKINIVPFFLVKKIKCLLFNSVGEDFEDAEEDDNMDEMEQPDDDAQIELLQQGEGGTGQLQVKRITTPYMTKYTFSVTRHNLEILNLCNNLTNKAYNNLNFIALKQILAKNELKSLNILFFSK